MLAGVLRSERKREKEREKSRECRRRKAALAPTEKGTDKGTDFVSWNCNRICLFRMGLYSQYVVLEHSFLPGLQSTTREQTII